MRICPGTRATLFPYTTLFRSISFPALGGMTGGGDDSSSPYQATYDWTASSTASGAQTVTAHNNAGITSTASCTLTTDTAPPTGAAVNYPNGYGRGSVTVTTGA